MKKKLELQKKEEKKFESKRAKERENLMKKSDLKFIFESGYCLRELRNETTSELQFIASSTF